jgi:TolA-binding protein
MKTGRWIGCSLAALSLAPLFLAPRHLAAQEPAAPDLKPFFTEDGIEVRRAEPVLRPPVTPGATNPDAPKQPAVVPGTREKQGSPGGVIRRPEVADPTAEIRITPQGTMRPEQMQLSIADRFYVQKSYDQAAPEYERFLTLYPNTSEKPNVLYRLGECYRALGAWNAAKNSYEALLGQFSNAELLGPAAYRLADIYYEERNFREALAHYRRASVRLRDPQLANAAKFFSGLCNEALGLKMEARGVYEDLVNTPESNPYLEASRLSYAQLLREAGRTGEALKQVQILAKQGSNEELKAQATVFSGLWQRDLGQLSRAAEDFRKALQMPGIGRRRDTALMGLLQTYFEEKKFAELIELYESAAKDTVSELRPQMLTLAGKAYRRMGKTREAVAMLDQILKEFPGSPAAVEAASERLAHLSNEGDPRVLEEIDAYLAAYPESTQRDLVLLMKAENLYKKRDYAAAALIYGPLEKAASLGADYRADAVFKSGVCFFQTKDYALAIRAYTVLIEQYPKAKSVGSALFQRGVARAYLKEVAGAARDFDEFLAKYPKAKEREQALQQKALILGQMGDQPGMAAAFQRLLKEYPETAAAAEANYWAGLVAFENKDYRTAVEPLERARKLNKEEFGERASLRILLSYFYLEDKRALGREIDGFEAGGSKRPVPVEVLRWMGQSSFDAAVSEQKPEARAEHYRNAAKYLALLVQRAEVKPEDYLSLGLSRVELGEFEGAAVALNQLLALAKEPGPRTLALLALGRAQLGLKEFQAAQKSVEGVLGLQPDGEYNARARMLAGDLQRAQGNLEQAAKVYESVAVIDHEQVTPAALEKAVETYRELGRDADARRLLNKLQSRYPEYAQRKRITL